MHQQPSAAAPAASYRRRLALLAEGRLVEGLLAEWADEEAVKASGPPGEWQRIYGKLRPGRSPWALLVFQAASGSTVAARLLERPDDAARPAGALGWVGFMPATEDPALPGLLRVLEALQDP